MWGFLERHHDDEQFVVECAWEGCPGTHAHAKNSHPFVHNSLWLGPHFLSCIKVPLALETIAPGPWEVF